MIVHVNSSNLSIWCSIWTHLRMNCDHDWSIWWLCWLLFVVVRGFGWMALWNCSTDAFHLSLRSCRSPAKPEQLDSVRFGFSAILWILLGSSRKRKKERKNNKETKRCWCLHGPETGCMAPLLQAIVFLNWSVISNELFYRVFYHYSCGMYNLFNVAYKATLMPPINE